MVTAITMLICGLLAKALAAASIGRGRQVPANIGIAVLQVAQVVGGLVALVESPTLQRFAVGTAIGACVGLIAVVAIIFYDERRIVVGLPKVTLAREILAFGMKGQVLGATDIVLYQSGKLIAGVMIGPAAAGAYELGLRLVRGVQAFGSAASVALTTHLTRVYAVGEDAAITADYLRLTRRNAAVAIFPPLFLAATAPSVVPLWLGERQNEVLMLVAGFAPGVAVNVTAGVCVATLMAMGRSGIVAAVSIISVTVAVVLALAFSHLFGYSGIVAAFGGWLIVGELLAVWFFHSRMRIPVGHYLRGVRGPLTLGVVAAIVALPFGIIAGPHDRSSALVPFFLSGIIFCAIYATLGWRLDYLPRIKPRGTSPSNAEAGSAGESRPSRSVAIIGTRGYPSFYGGFETLVRKLAPFLADRGWEVIVYCRPNATVESPQRLVKNIITITTKGIESKSLSTLTFGATAVFDASRRRPDVALVMNVANGYWLPMLKARRIPSVVNVDGIEWERDKWSKLGKALFKIGAHLTARFADVLIADSKRIRTYWENNFDRDSVFIPYGGDVPDENLHPVGGLMPREYVLLVARFVPENTVGEFLDAVGRIAAQFPVVIVGSSGCGGPLENRIRLLSESNDAITWLGHLADDRTLYSLWKYCGVYFHGHSVGGTNPALVQAMSCGAPIIARDTGYNREVLGDAGLYVEPDGDAIAAAVMMLMARAELQETLGSRAQIRANESYSWERICADYESCLSRAVGGAFSPNDVPLVPLNGQTVTSLEDNRLGDSVCADREKVD